MSSNGRGTYYFRRRIPDDVRALYPGRKGSLFFSLKTSDPQVAARKADAEARRQDALWASQRAGEAVSTREQRDAALALLAAHGLAPGLYEEFRRLDLEPDSFYDALSGGACGPEVVHERRTEADLEPYEKLALNLFRGEKLPPLLSEVIELHDRLRAGVGDEKAQRQRLKARDDFRTLKGDLPINEYTREDAREFVFALGDRGLSPATVKRYLAQISPVFATAVREYPHMGLTNPFSGIPIPGAGEVRKRRRPVTYEERIKVASRCREKDDDLRWIVALIADTGLRCAEAVGVKMDEIRLDAAVPHLIVQPNAARSLKTGSSNRRVPLVGLSLWAAGRIRSQGGDRAYAFPRYAGDGVCKATHASNTLNKWIGSALGGEDTPTLHSFRHALRDRLRDVSAPGDVADWIGGWAREGVGEGYGRGPSLETLQAWMMKIEDK